MKRMGVRYCEILCCDERTLQICIPPRIGNVSATDICLSVPTYYRNKRQQQPAFRNESSAIINCSVQTQQLLYISHDNITLYDGLCALCDPNLHTFQQATSLPSTCYLFNDAVSNSIIGLQRRLAGC